MKQTLEHTLPLSQEELQHKVKELAFEALFKNLPVGFYWMNKEGYLLGCNDVVLKIFNFSSLSQYVGKHTTELSRMETWENSQMVMAQNETMSLEEIHTRPDGSKVYYLSIKSPLHDVQGEVIGLLGISIDITERKEMEEELRIAKEKAEIADKAKTQFLAVASHELRIPLTGILGLVSFLKQGGLEPSEEEEYLNYIDHCSTHLLTIINDILDFAKLEAEQFQVSSLPINLKVLVEEVAAMLTASAKNKGIDLLVRIDPNTPTNILSDSRALRQVLVNLISNAIKFTEQGHILVKVNCLQQVENKAQLEIIVEDTGKGIPADKLDMVFEKFSQVEDAYTRDASKSGTGLGLAIVKKLTTLLDGTIHVTSEVGKGSSFHFVIECPLQTPAFMESSWSDYTSKVRVLIVDDSARGAVLCTNLGTVNCDVVSSAEVVNELTSAYQLGMPYHVLIVDQLIRHRDPLKLLQQVQRQKKLPALLPILLLAKSGQKEKMIAEDAGYFVTIPRSVQANVFQTALTSAWERWSELHSQADVHKVWKVLLVEDDKVVQLVHKRMLTEMNCQVDIAESGTETLQKCQNHRYDIVFVDVGLPDITGYEVMKKIRQNSNPVISGIPLIALTGYSTDEEKANCIAAGANEVMTKPITAEVLYEVLTKSVLH